MSDRPDPIGDPPADYPAPAPDPDEDWEEQEEEEDTVTPWRSLQLDKLAHALRGMPREAPVLVELPEGRLAQIVAVRPGHVTVRDGVLQVEAHGATYGIILRLASPE